MQHCEIESTLQPLNETLAQLVYGSTTITTTTTTTNHHHLRSNDSSSSNNNNIKQSQEKEILLIMKLMACIRTRALETGWDANCESDMEEIQSTLQRLNKIHL